MWPPLSRWEARGTEGFDPATSFGPEVAQRYGDHLRGDEVETVDFLAGLAGGGSALEFAIGTGRVAVPLSQRGVRVDGIELSPDMLVQLRGKPGGDKLDVTMGDMARASAPREKYALVYLVFNTIYNLLTQEDQVRCFENAARHLATDGVFVVEAGVPSAWLRRDQFVNVEHLTNGEVVLDVNRYDPVTQILDENHVPSRRTVCGSDRSHADLSGRAKWTSWRGSLRCGSLVAGVDGMPSRSRLEATAISAFTPGRKRVNIRLAFG